ncbi:MAG: HpcH/HpaI aldolase/citrate lyase family protein [Candidatus Hodarchaeales archaeon]|jgi:citrate lyase subunit beta/citryl-CoA lyase
MKNSSQKRDMNKFVRRSSLIFPINVERFLEKAYLRGADCIVMDLEDSISVNMKNEARALVKNSIPIVGKGGSDISVRINQPLNLAIDDLEASIWPGLTCIHLPKVESAEEIHVLNKIISRLERRRGIKAGTIQLAIIVETALGVNRGYEIAAASPRIVSISLGIEDLTKEMGIEVSHEGLELWYARTKILTDAYAAGIQPLGIVGVDPFTWKEPKKIREAAERSRKLGFKGALSIHPTPIPYINEGFSIPEKEISYARNVVKLFEKGLKGGVASINIDNRMIDIASVERYEKILERVDAINKTEEKKRKALMNPDK